MSVVVWVSLFRKKRVAYSECRCRGQSAVDDVIVVACYVPASLSSGVRGRGTALHCSGVTSSRSRALFSTISEVFILRRGMTTKKKWRGVFRETETKNVYSVVSKWALQKASEPLRWCILILKTDINPIFVQSLIVYNTVLLFRLIACTSYTALIHLEGLEKLNMFNSYVWKIDILRTTSMTQKPIAFWEGHRKVYHCKHENKCSLHVLLCLINCL